MKMLCTSLKILLGVTAVLTYLSFVGCTTPEEPKPVEDSAVTAPAPAEGNQVAPAPMTDELKPAVEQEKAKDPKQDAKKAKAKKAKKAAKKKAKAKE